MPGKPTTLYHMDEQYADALLTPIAASLTELEGRLTQFVDRLYLSLDDRTRVEQALDLIAETRRRLEPIVQPRSGRTLSRGSQ